MVMAATANSLQFIAAAGVSGFLCGVQTGMVNAAQAQIGFDAIGSAVDAYVEVQPGMESLVEVRSSIDALPDNISHEELIRKIDAHNRNLDLAVRFAERTIAVGAEVAAPFNLDSEWRWIPAGTFRKGRQKGGDKWTIVMTGGLYMLDHPVSNAEFRTFLKETGRDDLRQPEQKHDRKRYRKFAGDFQPAVMVSHEEATSYSRWLGERIAEKMGISIVGRLPSGDEWEKAAKGPNDNEFLRTPRPGQAHMELTEQDVVTVTRAVNHPDAYANGYGLKDMIGNVWEWTSSSRDDFGLQIFGVRGHSFSEYFARNATAAFGGTKSGSRHMEVGFRPVLVSEKS